MKKYFRFFLTLLFAFILAGSSSANAAGVVTLSDFNISGTSGQIMPGSNVGITANAVSSDASTVYYKFFYCANYGSSAYDTTPWTVIQNYSDSNSASFSFPQAGNYVVVVRAVTDPNNEPANLPLIGGVVSVGSPSTQITLTSFGSSATGSVNTGEQVTFTANAYNPGGGSVYYRFYKCPNYGKPEYATSTWTIMQDYSTNNTCRYAFTDPGPHIVVVRAVSDPLHEPEYPSIAGAVVDIKSSGSGNNDNQNQDGNSFTMTQTISDNAQVTTLAFAALGMMTGNLEAQSFFPPGKLADYTGFQYLRDNDPDSMGHNTSFLTKIANNVLYLLNDSQLTKLKTTATAQISQINDYGYKRFALMKAFRRLMDGDVPVGSTGLDLEAVKTASRELYAIDGQISYDRAVLYSDIFRSLDSTQKAYLENMKGNGWNSWPTVDDSLVRDKLRGLSHDESVAVMTYAGDLFSWYAGSVEADVYFCPERHGTYFGSFYIKDAPAIGHEGYSINEQLTATAGSALCDSSKGYVTTDQAARISSLVNTQRNNLYADESNIVQVRTDIATALRSLISDSAPSESAKSQIKSLVLTKSETYGDLDGENNYNYATVFAEVYKTLTTTQKTKLSELRKSIMSGTYSDGTAFDFSLCTTPFLFSAAITDTSILQPYISDTDYLF